MVRQMVKRICQRCGEIPHYEDAFHRGIGARSRTDNKSQICSDCGVDEAMEDFRGKLTPKSEWPVSDNLYEDETPNCDCHW